MIVFNVCDRQGKVLITVGAYKLDDVVRELRKRLFGLRWSYIVRIS